MEYRKVVTSFLQYEDRILILKRSSRVGSMQGRWAGISGYLEKDEDPYERALKEVREETGLSENHVQFIRRGEPVKAKDLIRDDLVWIVHPFLFQVETPEVRLDWEHDEYRWIRPDEMNQYSTVPSLKEALEKVIK